MILYHKKLPEKTNKQEITEKGRNGNIQVQKWINVFFPVFATLVQHLFILLLQLWAELLAYNIFFLSQVDCDALAVMAATLANGGICPTTGDKVYIVLHRSTFSTRCSCAAWSRVVTVRLWKHSNKYYDILVGYILPIYIINLYFLISIYLSFYL